MMHVVVCRLSDEVPDELRKTGLVLLMELFSGCLIGDCNRSVSATPSHACTHAI